MQGEYAVQVEEWKITLMKGENLIRDVVSAKGKQPRLVQSSPSSYSVGKALLCLYGFEEWCWWWYCCLVSCMIAPRIHAFCVNIKSTSLPYLNNTEPG